MNWLKPMLLMMVLGAILYGVYVVLNKGPAPEPPPGVGRDWAKPVDIQLGTVEDDKGGPPPMPISRPGERMNSGGQSQYPTATYPPPSGSTAPQDAAHDPFARNEQNPPLPEAPRNDPSNAAAPLFSPSRDPAAGGPLGSRPDDAGKRGESQESFAAAMDSSKRLLMGGKLVEALRKLTKWNNSPQLNPEESRQLNELLSQLAGTVVYSRQHLLQPAYKVQTGDRLETIAAQYNVPWQLLAKINAIADPNQLVPGEELKVVRGPFSALVDLDKRQLTLIVEDCYAGRFSLVAVGDMARNLDGSFEVGQKLKDGPNSPPGSVSPIHHWVELGANSNVWIVGTSDPASIHPSGLNLNSRDAEDVYDILSMGSRVTVRR